MEDFPEIPEPKEPIDEYMLLRLKAQQQISVIKSVSRMITGTVTVLGVLYLSANNIALSEQAWYVVFAVVAGMYGLDGILTFIQHRNGRSL